MSLDVKVATATARGFPLSCDMAPGQRVAETSLPRDSVSKQYQASSTPNFTHSLFRDANLRLLLVVFPPFDTSIRHCNPKNHSLRPPSNLTHFAAPNQARAITNSPYP